jgi:hypothetical protein
VGMKFENRGGIVDEDLNSSTWGFSHLAAPTPERSLIRAVIRSPVSPPAPLLPVWPRVTLD